MTAHRALRRWAHRGSIVAAGVSIDVASGLVHEAEARTRLLALGAGAPLDVYRLGGHLVALFRAPTRIDCATAIGAPLVRYGALFAAAPLEDDERAALESTASGARLVLVDGGVVTVRPLADATPEDLATWLDVSAFTLADDAEPLGDGPLTLAPLPPPTLPPVGGLREPFGVAPFNAEGAAMLEALQGRGRTEPPSGIALLVLRLAAAIGILVRRARRWAGSSSSASTPSPFWSWLEGLAQRFLDWSRLTSLLAKHDLEYLRKMLELLDGNDLDSALRHAIPLTDGASESASATLTARFRARDDFTIQTSRTGVTRAATLESSLFARLRARYRRIFEKLVAAGEIDKAAFVLAELLNATDEAVSFLETHGRYALAAQLAEARKLPPGLVVRQWFLAGDVERAVRIARRHGAFADAVARLEATGAQRARAQELRMVWADVLASGGAFAAAVDVAWNVPDARPLTLAWIDRAIAVGGPTAARMRVRKIRSVPEEAAETRDALLASLDAERDEDDESSLPEANAAAREILQGNVAPVLRPLAKVVARHLLASRVLLDDPHAVDRLLAAVDDPLLAADVKALGAPRKTVATATPMLDVSVDAFGAKSAADADGAWDHEAVMATALGLKGERTTACRASATTEGLWLGVTRGIAGWEASHERAARLAATHMLAHPRDELAALHTGFADGVAGWATALMRAVENASRGLHEMTGNGGAPMDACAEGAFATVSGRTLLIAHAGAARAYVLRKGVFTQLTRDHSLANDLIERGELAPEDMPAFEAKNPNFDSILTAAFGMSRDTVATVVGVELEDEDVVFMCTRSLHAVVPTNEIARALASGSPEASAAKIAEELSARDDGKGFAMLVAKFRLRNGPPAGWGPLEILSRETLLGRTRHGAGPRSPIDHLRPAGDCGAFAIFDAAELPDGRLLVALGEIGVWLVARDGRVVARFGEPAQHIVLSDHGGRAILLAERGEAFRIAQLDVTAKRVAPWTDARISTFARTFDGSTWLVAHGSTLFAIDATSLTWEALWDTDIGAPHVYAITRDPLSAHVLAGDGTTDPSDRAPRTIATFDAATFTLRRRVAVVDDDATRFADALTPTGEPVALSGEPASSIAAGSTHSAASRWFHDGGVVSLHETRSPDAHVTVRLEGATRAPGVRFQGPNVIVFDDRGRAIVVRARTGKVLREHRIS